MPEFLVHCVFPPLFFQGLCVRCCSLQSRGTRKFFRPKFRWEMPGIVFGAKERSFPRRGDRNSVRWDRIRCCP
jgi:hypothetical protein